MRNGLYGKLPSKRDFIALSTSREFLAVWEPWIQGGMSASQTQLGDLWRPAYLRAPIWRFWLGADLCGEAVLGAFMPSIDEVGRYFPLTVFVRSDAFHPLSPPEYEPQSAWYAAAEDFLLATLEPNVPFETTTEALDRLVLPQWSAAPETGPRCMRLSDGTLLLKLAEDDVPSAFAGARAFDRAASQAAMSFWWTMGGDGFAPLGLAKKQMPDRFLFAGFLTGDFGR